MKQFTADEHQYIFMLATRAMQDLKKSVEAYEEQWGKASEDDNPLIKAERTYIIMLEEIREKAGANMKEQRAKK